MTNDEQTKSVESKIESASLVERLLSPQQWIRFLFMVLFTIIVSVLSYVIGLLVLLQFIFSLLTGRDNDKLRHFGRSCSAFIFQALQFLTYNSEEKPFPFADWPDAGAENEDGSPTEKS